MDPDRRDVFRQLLEKQHAAYARMAAMVAEQGRALETGDAEVLMPLAEQASALKQEAEALQLEMAPLREEWEASRDSIPEADRDLLKTLMEDIRHLLQEMLEAMSKLRGGLDDSRDEKLTRLKDLQRGQAARKGYTDLGRLRQPPGGRFMDRDG